MKPAQQKLRDRLKETRGSLAEARSSRTKLREERDCARDAFANAELPKDVKFTETNEFKQAQEAVRALGVCEDQIADLQLTETGILELLGSGTDIPTDPNKASEVARRMAWDGHGIVANSEEFQAARESRLFSSGHQFGTVSVGEIASREDFLAALPAASPGTIGTDQGAVVPDVRGIVQPPYRRLTLLDLIPIGTTDSNIVEYVQVTATPQGAAETAELAAKPQEGLTTVDATAPVRTIAGWVKTARQALDDVAGLGTLINTLLPYDVRRRLEAQVLKGDGIGQNILGILNTSGVAVLTHTTGDNPADAILRAITTVVLSDQDPNFVALNPVDWQALLMMKAAGSGEYLYGSPGLLQAPTIWGLAITSNRVVTANTPLVGDAMGASILIREGVNIKISDSDQDDFIKNRVTILAEARAAVPVWRPSAFAVAALS